MNVSWRWIADRIEQCSPLIILGGWYAVSNWLANFRFKKEFSQLLGDVWSKIATDPPLAFTLGSVALLVVATGILISSVILRLRRQARLASEESPMDASRLATLLGLLAISREERNTALVEAPNSPVTSRYVKTLPVQERGVVAFLGAIGVIGNAPDACLSGGHRARSAVAAYFLASLRASIKDEGRRYFGDWSASIESNEGKALREMLLLWEKDRSAHHVGTFLPTAARKVRSALACIIGDMDGARSLLMLRNFGHDPSGAWWFPGGTEKPEDEDLSFTLRRELSEELGIAPRHIANIREVLVAQDRLISARTGVLTEYEFHVFDTHLDFSQTAVLPFQKRQTTRDRHVGSYMRSEHFMWILWDDIVISKHLKNHAPNLLEQISKLKPTELESNCRVVS